MMTDTEDRVTFSLGELAAVGLLRSIAGFGLGLLFADLFQSQKRKRVGWALFLGSTVVGLPVGMTVVKKLRT